MDPCYEPAKESHRSMSPLQTCRCLESFQGGGEIISIKRAIVETRPRGPEKAMTPEPSGRGTLAEVGEGVLLGMGWQEQGLEGLAAVRLRSTLPGVLRGLKGSLWAMGSMGKLLRK